ncbi:hypothetical protein LCGC14_1843950 [marine sediment metagenome]|uniref:Uncharacterized protein n=1 Tax=marine sediment metagenome TaxID=412755 RepID=A0A0F9H0N1_9ZZZZ
MDEGSLLLQHPLVWWLCPVCDWAISGVERECVLSILSNAECRGCGCRNLSEYGPVAKPIYWMKEIKNES